MLVRNLYNIYRFFPKMFNIIEFVDFLKITIKVGAAALMLVSPTRHPRSYRHPFQLAHKIHAGIVVAKLMRPALDVIQPVIVDHFVSTKTGRHTIK